MRKTASPSVTVASPMQVSSPSIETLALPADHGSQPGDELCQSVAVDPFNF
jgi:hypothetical protein